MAPSQQRLLRGERKRNSDPLKDLAFLADLTLDFPRRQLLESVAEEDVWSDIAATEPIPALSVSGSLDFRRDSMPAYVPVRTLKNYQRGKRFLDSSVPKLELFKFVAEQDTNRSPVGVDAQSEPAPMRRPPGLFDILNGDSKDVSRSCAPPSPSPESIHEFIHELARRSAASKEASQDDANISDSQKASVVMNLSELPFLPGLLAVAAEPKRGDRQESECSVSEQSLTQMPTKKKADYIRLRYTQNDQQGSPAGLTLVAGASVQIPAIVSIDSGKQGALEKHIRFAVHPRLPDGLIFCKRTGLISGIPKQVQENPSVHEITVSIPAMGANGTPLGRLPLTSCTILVRTIDLSHYVQSPSVSTNEDDEALVLKLRKSCPVDGIEKIAP
jgi:hypothetical protein